MTGISDSGDTTVANRIEFCFRLISLFNYVSIIVAKQNTFISADSIETHTFGMHIYVHHIIGQLNIIQKRHVTTVKRISRITVKQKFTIVGNSQQMSWQWSGYFNAAWWQWNDRYLSTVRYIYCQTFARINIPRHKYRLEEVFEIIYLSKPKLILIYKLIFLHVKNPPLTYDITISGQYLKRIKTIQPWGIGIKQLKPLKRGWYYVIFVQYRISFAGIRTSFLYKFCSDSYSSVRRESQTRTTIVLHMTFRNKAAIINRNDTKSIAIRQPYTISYKSAVRRNSTRPHPTRILPFRSKECLSPYSRIIFAY